jgi:CelD/BcsL family acetyltransferase involved in cellulose biosynthesis
MHVQRVHTAKQLLDLQAAWSDLAGDIPFRGWHWYATWWLHYGGSGELYVLAVRDERQSLVAVAPWYLSRSAAQGRVLRFLGSGEVCSDYQTILCRTGCEALAASALAEFLTDARGSLSAWVTGGSDAWDLLELTGVEAGDDTIQAVLARLAADGHELYLRPGLHCWRLALPDSWEAYEAMLSKSHRKQLRRLQSRVLDAGRAVMHTVAGPDDFEQAWNILIDLHQRRWQAVGQPGVFDSPRFAAFHRDVAAEFLDQGRLRLHWLELDGAPAAAEYHLAGGDTVFAYQSGADPLRREDEPGRLIALTTLRAAMDEGFRYVDFLRGDEPYKAHFRATPRPCVEIRVVPPRASSRMRHGMWAAGRKIKKWLSHGGDAAGTAQREWRRLDPDAVHQAIPAAREPATPTPAPDSEDSPRG